MDPIMSSFGEKNFMEEADFRVNSWLAEYVYEQFWKCYLKSGVVTMGLRSVVVVVVVSP